MKARVEEMRAKVTESEAEVPMAMAEALRSGNLGVMDYMNIQNVMSDTDMRESISKSGKDDDQNGPYDRPHTDK